ncbi:MAG: AIR synthase-related protein, partial [Rhodospirillales bacterium]|nr:AIR synthase-related protein [Rhodospirillales bacterium]
EGAGLAVALNWDQLPILDTATAYAQKGYATGAGTRNWQSFGDHVVLPDGIEDWQKNLLVDPQTSGGLLVTCPPAAVDDILAVFQGQGFDKAAVVGNMSAGEPKVTVE